MAENQLIGVVGAGTMGAGIAYTAALHGYEVRCMDADRNVLHKSFAGLREMADKRVSQGKLSLQHLDETFRRLAPAAATSDLRDADVIIEAIVEDLGAKRKLFIELERVCSPRAVLATNTSSISVTSLAEPLAHPERFVGMHFFNPAPVMPLVEVIPGAKTGQQTMVSTVALARAMGKTPVRAKDRPGFIANRVARPFYLEALSLLECGYADMMTIDTASKSAGFPMGPFELLDLIGLDVNLAVTRTVYEGFARAHRFAPNPIQEKLVADGRLGRKAGRGFYDHSGAKPAPAFDTRVKGVSPRALEGAAFKAFAAALARPADVATWLYARIMSAVINEGIETVGEKTALARDVDLAMTLGLRYPAGPMELADHVGLDVVLALLKSFHEDGPSGRHTPAQLLLEKVNDGELGEKTGAGLLRHSL